MECTGGFDAGDLKQKTGVLEAYANGYGEVVEKLCCSCSRFWMKSVLQLTRSPWSPWKRAADVSYCDLNTSG